MSRVLLIIAFCLFFSQANAQKKDGTVRDADGNIYPVKLMPDNKTWMTTNLNVNIPGSFDYKGAGQKNQYGRLYSWKSAQAGCEMLGEGWHLPSNKEWQQLAKQFGGVVDDSEDGGKATYQALIPGGRAAFDVVYGGRRDSTGTFSRVGDHGFYWTATQRDAATAWLYNFGKNGKLLNRHEDGAKQWAISVRCVK